MATINQTVVSAPDELSPGTAMHWIGGRWLDSGEHRESINPATGEVIGTYAKGGRKEAELAVNAARRAFLETDWQHNRSLRARVLNSMAARFEARAEGLAQLLATEVGKILPHARFETSTVPFLQLTKRSSHSVRKRLVVGTNEIRTSGENLRGFGHAGMNIHAEGGELGGQKVLGIDLLSFRLNRRITPKQTREVQHRHAKRFADEVAGLVDGNAVRRGAVAVQDEDPSETVLRDLCAKVGHK